MLQRFLFFYFSIFLFFYFSIFLFFYFSIFLFFYFSIFLFFYFSIFLFFYFSIFLFFYFSIFLFFYFSIFLFFYFVVLRCDAGLCVTVYCDRTISVHYSLRTRTQKKYVATLLRWNRPAIPAATETVCYVTRAAQSYVGAIKTYHLYNDTD